MSQLSVQLLEMILYHLHTYKDFVILLHRGHYNAFKLIILLINAVCRPFILSTGYVSYLSACKVIDSWDNKMVALTLKSYVGLLSAQKIDQELLRESI